MDSLFPRFCLGCGREGAWLCARCECDIIPVISQVCPACGRLSPGGRYCKSHRRGMALKGIVAAAHYNEGALKELVHNLKYNSVTELVPLLGERMAEALARSSKQQVVCSKHKNLATSCHLPVTILSFVPLHWLRRSQRGYNQAELLAREVGKRLEIPVTDLLARIKKTVRQVELSGKRRRENLEKVFRIKNQESRIKGKAVILVDDVATTGTTLNECARVLKSAGAKEVWGLVISLG